MGERVNRGSAVVDSGPSPRCPQAIRDEPVQRYPLRHVQSGRRGIMDAANGLVIANPRGDDDTILSSLTFSFCSTRLIGPSARDRCCRAVAAGLDWSMVSSVSPLLISIPIGGVFAQPERGAVLADFPAFGHAAGELVALVVAGQAFLDVAEDANADGIGGAGGVELGRGSCSSTGMSVRDAASTASRSRPSAAGASRAKARVAMSRGKPRRVAGKTGTPWARRP